MKSLPSRRFGRFGISRSAGRSGGGVAETGGGWADKTVSASQSVVTVSPSTVVNDGSSTATVTVTLVNASGTPLSGKTVTLSSTGSNNTIVQPGVTDSNGETTGTIASTTAEAKTVTAVSEGVTVTDTAAVTFTATPTLVMASSFKRGGLGSDVTDVQDGTYWDGNYTNNGGAEVVASTGTDFPADANVLRFMPQIGTAGAFIIEKESLGTPSVGTTRYYRWYWSHEWPYTGDTDADNTHPIQDGTGGIGGTSWHWDIHTLSGDTTYRVLLGVAVNNGENTFANAAWGLMTPLDKSTVYRFELAIERLSTTTFGMHMRVYDASGTLLYDDSDFGAYNNGNTPTLASNPTFTFRNAGSGVDGADTLSLLKVGCNGIIDSVVSTQHYADQTGFAISDEGWVGPYITGEADV